MKLIKAYLRPLVIASALGALFVVTRFLPLQGGGAGTPPGVLVMGAITGLLTALTAVSIVLIYRTSRIFNFAAAALGSVGAVFAYNFMTIWNLPFGFALVAAILIGALIGVVIELVLRRFFDAPRLVLTVATIGVMGFLQQQAAAISFLPIWPDDGRSVIDRGLGTLIRPLEGFSFTIRPFEFGFGHLLALILVPLALLGIGFFLRRTRLGTAVRASSENAERAEMLGINVKLLSTVVWAIAGALAALALTLQGTIETFTVAANTNAEVLLPAFAAAVLAGMRSMPVAAMAAVGLSVLNAALRWSFPDGSAAIIATVALVITVLGPLLMLRRQKIRDREVSSWEAIEETRPVPPQLASIPEVRTWRNVLIGIGVGAVLLFPWLTTSGPTNLAGAAAISGIVLLSLVVLTGWTGQVSLGHWGLLGVGALIGGALTSRADLSFWLALPVGGALTAVIAGLIGLPALRIRGLMLAVTTFAFSFFVWLVLFNERWFGWLLPDAVQRPTLLLVDFEDERSMYYLSVLFLALAFAVVAAIRRGRPGRVLLALRENEDDLASIGINPVKARLSAFVLSGFLVGIAGVLFAHHQRAVTPDGFLPFESLSIFLFAIIGGLGAPAGALLAAGVRVVEQTLAPSDPLLAFFLNPAVGVIAILYIAPRGLWGIVQAGRDSVLRVIAQRRGILAPTLFADVDAEAIEKRLVLMAEPDEGRGLAALSPGRRYRLESQIYGAKASGNGHASQERATWAAAADAMYERETERPGSGTTTMPREED